MPDSFSIHSPKPSDDGERVYFTIEADGAKGKGYISRSALDELAGGHIGDLGEVFDKHRDRIEEAVHLKWLVNPSLDPIVLSSDDF
ncbi:conserved hypothetical protein [Cupriavidus necator]|uniref:Uncharacterized protein n=1 Tax=Cupriavidus necator TaxID=106590 RepID=A0A1K0IW74_CUPNE|nr:conserved hypothetical protein [Cupriavidus necator]